MKNMDNELKQMIDNAKVVSFDIFGILLRRTVNTIDSLYEIIGKNNAIHGFKKLRKDAEMSLIKNATGDVISYPDIESIYTKIQDELHSSSINLELIMDYEVQIFSDSCTANKEISDIYKYAVSSGKTVIGIYNDPYSVDEIMRILELNDYSEIQNAYRACDIHDFAVNKKLPLTGILSLEDVKNEEILHIGSFTTLKEEFFTKLNVKTYQYIFEDPAVKIKDAADSDVDKAFYSLLFDESKNFWYNLGIECAGPLYMGLYKWLTEKTANSDKKLFFLSCGGYNLYNIFREMEEIDIDYLEIAPKSLILATIDEADDKDLALIPEYDEVHSLDEEELLKCCAAERNALLKYLESKNFLLENADIFAADWEGMYQYLIEKLKKKLGITAKHFYYQTGITNSPAAIKNVNGTHYDTFLFNFYKDYSLQSSVRDNVHIYDLFFSTPDGAVTSYSEDGEVIKEISIYDSIYADISRAIINYVTFGYDFVNKYNIEYTNEMSAGHIKRLLLLPTAEEAKNIGNLQIIDKISPRTDLAKTIAYVDSDITNEGAEKAEVFWIRGLINRDDVPEDIKTIIAAKFYIIYPEVISPYHLEDETNIRNYHRWLNNQFDDEVVELKYKPKFSFVIPVYNTATDQLKECIESVLNQVYTNFELILVDDNSSWDNVVPVLKSYEKKKNVKVIYRKKNGHISAATNDGIFESEGDFIVFMDCDDTIEPRAIYEMAKLLNENPELDFIYTDEDKITEDGKIKHMPFFKPDWSPDLFQSMMYTNHLATYRASIVKSLQGLRSAYNGSQDYDMTLRFLERTENKRVGHISMVLYHWRERKESVAFAMTSKNYAAEAAKYAKEDMIRRNNISAHIEYVSSMSQYRIIYHVVGNPLVSIIIPSKDHPEILKQCIDSIHEYTDYNNYEIIVVDNGSNPVNKARLEKYLADMKATYIYDKADFNFSKMCNQGAAAANGEYLLFLNDDIEIFQPDWLRRLLGHAQLKYIGAVGAKLFYPGTIKLQHAGVLNKYDGPVHSFATYDDNIPYYFGFNWMTHDAIAVTGACLLLSKKKFEEAGRFDESLPVAYNDVDLCFSLYEKGYYNVVRQDAVCFHHESLSRGNDTVNDAKLIRLAKELCSLRAKYPNIANTDPFLGKYLRNHSMQLDLLGCYDTVVPCDLKGIPVSGHMNFDMIAPAEFTRLLGWSYVIGEEDMDNYERFLIIKDPYGNTFKAPVLSSNRPDVTKHLGDGKLYKNAGFDCVIKSSQLRLDIIPLQFGILNISKITGAKSLTWWEVKKPTMLQNPRIIGLDVTPLHDFQRFDTQSDIQWNLDGNDRCEGYHCIRGYAFRRGNLHYQYETTLVLSDGSNEAFEFKVHKEERLDVATAFMQTHFLLNTGFKCYIFDTVLKPNTEYDVVIRLRNQFNPHDIQDILTGAKVIV